jgi:hypothetical protein
MLSIIYTLESRFLYKEHLSNSLLPSDLSQSTLSIGNFFKIRSSELSVRNSTKVFRKSTAVTYSDGHKSVFGVHIYELKEVEGIKHEKQGIGEKRLGYLIRKIHYRNHNKYPYYQIS